MKVELRIEGMTCAHCAESLSRALGELPGVRAEVSFAERAARIETDGRVSTAELVAAIGASGYSAVHVEAVARAAPEVDGRGLHIAILGSGSGAFAAALRAAERGARVTMIEAGTVGGTCVNFGCVPSKILLRGAHVAHTQREHPFAGVGRTRPLIDRLAMVEQQQERVAELRRAKYEDLVAGNPAIELVRGFAAFEDAQTLRIASSDGSARALRADRFLIATGASPAVPPIPGLMDVPFWTSTEALVAEELPQHLVVLGGSLVAVELAQAFQRLGAEVTLMARSTLLSKEEPALGAGLAEALEGEEMKVLLHTVPTSVRHDASGFHLETAHGSSRGTVFSSVPVAAPTRRGSGSSTLALRPAAAPSSSTIICARTCQTFIPSAIAPTCRSSSTWRLRRAPAQRST